MAVEQGAGGVDQRIVFVVAFHEHGVEAGDGAGAEGAGALDEAGKQSEDRGRVAFGGGRFAGGESDFALRHGETGERIDDQQNVLAAGAEIFGDGRGGESGADAEQRVLVGSGDDDDGTAAAFFAERVEKFSDFAAAFADQAEDGEVGAGVAGHHADERAFADAAAAKDADALAASAGKESVDGANAAAERLADQGAFEGERSFAIERITLAADGSGKAVNRISSAIEHAAEQLFAEAQRRTPSPNHDLVAIADAGGTAQGHGKNGVAAEADNFSRPVLAAGIDDFAGFADGAEGTFGFDQLTDNLDHSAAPAQGRRVFEMGEISGEDRRSGGCSHSAALRRAVWAHSVSA